MPVSATLFVENGHLNTEFGDIHFRVTACLRPDPCKETRHSDIKVLRRTCIFKSHLQQLRARRDQI